MPTEPFFKSVPDTFYIIQQTVLDKDLQEPSVYNIKTPYQQVARPQSLAITLPYGLPRPVTLEISPAACPQGSITFSTSRAHFKDLPVWHHPSQYIGLLRMISHGSMQVHIFIPLRDYKEFSPSDVFNEAGFHIPEDATDEEREIQRNLCLMQNFHILSVNFKAGMNEDFAYYKNAEAFRHQAYS